MSVPTAILLRIWLAAALCLTTTACGPRVLISTGTTLGLKATPGDLQTRPPQVTLAYRRAEMSLVPTQGDTAVDCPNPAPNPPRPGCVEGSGSQVRSRDAFSTLTAFHFSTRWFGETELASVIATGHAARRVAKPDSQFTAQFAEATLVPVDAALQRRRVELSRDLATMDEAQAERAVAILGLSRDGTAVQAIADAILTANTPGEMTSIEAAVHRAMR